MVSRVERAKEQLLKVAIIGAGAAGLAATKRVSESLARFECCTFEQSNSVGGTWVYTDKTGKDDYGLPIHSSMYMGFRTNLPKEIMEFHEFGYEEPNDKSYLTSEEVLKYLEEYADRFNLRTYIKFRHHVKNIVPAGASNWKIDVVDLSTQREMAYYFDVVIICTGSYRNPSYPNLKGMNVFKGFQIHSNDYRKAGIFRDMNVLVIGCGPSGVDITFQIADFAKTVIASHHNDELKNLKFPINVQQKPDVEKLTDDGAWFADGTFCKIDAVIYCTGYTYKYPFLGKECGITVENNVVGPLYKHFLNINYPSMCFIGIPRYIPGFVTFDLQVRCFLNIAKGLAKLPSRNEMLKDTADDMGQRIRDGHPVREYHVMKSYTKNYLDSLADLGRLQRVKLAIFKVFADSYNRALSDFANFRNTRYTLLDTESYVVDSLIYSNPSYPNLKGMDDFKGFQMHRHDYRNPGRFRDMKVLVIGCGSSGLDITFEIANVAKTVILSHHNDELKNSKFPINVQQKPDVEKFTDDGVWFADGTFCKIDAVVYCTGYTYKYPFLDKEFGITVENNVVGPLYKHFLNINYPSMCFIGIPTALPLFSTFDLQVCCFLNILKDLATLPPKNEMLKDTADDMAQRIRDGQPQRKYHIMKSYEKNYLDSLADLGRLQRVKPVIFKVLTENSNRAYSDFANFRNHQVHPLGHGILRCRLLVGESRLKI